MGWVYQKGLRESILLSRLFRVFTTSSALGIVLNVAYHLGLPCAAVSNWILVYVDLM